MPITYHMPKPLLPIIGKSLIEIALEKFTAISSGKIGINLHYKSEMMCEWIAGSAFASRIELFPENPILGTGGALKNAASFLSDGHFLVHNADIISDIDISLLIETHLSSGNIATLATHDYPKYNNVVVDNKGLIINVENPGISSPNHHTNPKKVAYTGIAAYSPEILKFLPSGISHATDAWLSAGKAGYRVQSLDFTGRYWSDIGSPSDYASAVINALRTEGETVYMHPSAEGCRDVEMNGYIVIERGSILGKGISLRNCIVLPETKIENERQGITPSIPHFGRKGEVRVFQNCIIGQDFRIDLSESEMLGSNNDAILIGTGGSNRKYYRVKQNGKTAVLMKCNNGDADYHRHIEYTNFFLKYSIPVPELIATDTAKMSALFEDLGDISLYSWLKCRQEPEQIENMYRKVLDMLILIHTKATEHVSECPILQNRLFDYEYYRWETSYFIERFVENIKNIKPKNPLMLQDEFHRLAPQSSTFPKTIIHRDFQSQNIMIHKGIPRLIDYQGARIGLPAYDVVSILWDPYFRLEDNMRERLLKYYINGMTERHFTLPPETLLICRLQRHMQALGAYGFLSSVIGKKYFLKHAQEGLRLLKEDVAIAKDKYPELHELVMRL